MNFILPSTAASLPLLLLSHLDHCSAFAGLPFPLPSSLPQPPLSTRAIANEHNNNHQGMIISLSSPLSTRGTRRQKQVNGRRGKIRNDGIIPLYGISEWRDQSLESYYSLEAYQMQQQQNQQQNQIQNRPQNTPSNTLSAIPSKIPILPFPFPDLLFPGQRTQLNLYESRFHSLFQDVMENYAGVVAMGLLTGSIGPANTGMITTLPLCEVESYSRMGGVDPEKFVDRGDGMGNGSIFVSIRAAGRVKIMEGELERSDPYMVGRVREMMDEELVEGGELEEGSRLARDIETVIGNLARLEKKWKDMDEKRRSASSFADGSKEVVIESKSKTDNDDGEGEDGDSVMNRRLLNAQLESLFMMDDIDNEGIILEEGDNQFDDGNDDEVEDDNDCNDSNDDEDYDYDDENDNQMNRLAQFHNAIQMAMEADSHGYVTTTTATTAESSSPFPSSTTTASNNNSSKSDKLEIKTPKELTAISWAAFCTSPSYYATSSYAAMTSRGNGSNDGSGNDYFINIAQDVFKIQALDMTNVLSRMKLALAMLREEEKKLIAKLALKGIANDSKDEDEGDEAL